MTERDRKILRTFRFAFWFFTLFLGLLSLVALIGGHTYSVIVLEGLAILCVILGIQFDRLDR